MNKPDQKKQIFAFLFVIASLFLFAFLFTKNKKDHLIKNGKEIYVEISDIQVHKAAFDISYKFTVNDKIYTGMRSERFKYVTLTQLRKELLGKKLIGLYENDNPKNNTVLLFFKDFDYFHIKTSNTHIKSVMDYIERVKG